MLMPLMIVGIIFSAYGFTLCVLSNFNTGVMLTLFSEFAFLSGEYIMTR